MKKLNIMNHDVQYCYHAEREKKKNIEEIKNCNTYVLCSTRSGSSSRLVSHIASFLFSDDPLHKNCLVSNIFSMENDMNMTNQNELICLIIRYLHRFNGKIERK